LLEILGKSLNGILLGIYYIHKWKINFKNLSKFIKSEKNITEQEDDGYSYIFPEYNLVLYVDYIEQNFMQILIYDGSLKELYEG